jgi:pyridinium-3,5-biscarboxylic acid mononucleotide sulfurtransferase
MDELHVKKQKLDEYLKSLGSIAVAFSGGVDSTFLLKSAYDVLGDKAIAVTARSSTFPERELKESTAFAQQSGIRQIVIDSEELSIRGYTENPADRCYYCKSELFSKIRNTADENGIKYIAEGSNMDDLGDYRPGLRAAEEKGAVSPLRAAGLHKEEIRLLSREMGLPTWDKPSYACLASRVPYGEKITREKLSAIDEAEQYLIDLGLRQVRVRHHGEIARIELLPEDMKKLFESALYMKVYEKIKALGFTYVALDLKGYTTGSMNAVLDKKTIEGAKLHD